MPSITFNDFSGGLDRRLPINVQEASRLWVLRNAVITTGKRIRKRPALKRVTTGLSGSLGLESINGQITVFCEVGSTFVPPSDVSSIQLNRVAQVGDGYATLLDVVYADMFQGFPYVVGRYYGRFPVWLDSAFVEVHRHHYVDGSPSTRVTDPNCPQGASVTKAASRIFSTAGDVVRYCAAGAARDWTTTSDAGFLPTGLQQDTRADCTAVGTFQDSLVVFFEEGVQIWDVAVDPSANAIRKRIFGVGCEQPYTLASWANDLSFLSPFGFRSMTVTEQTDRIDDTDVGVQIDPLVLADLAAYALLDPLTTQPLFGIWIPQLGQYWTVIDTGATSKAWVFTYSKTSKIACWSEFVFPVQITGITTRAGKVYIRSADVLYALDAATYTDDGTPIAVEVQMAFQDAKTPGVSKQFTGADFVIEGSPDISYRYDPRDQSKETISQTISGDTRPGDVTSVEVVATALAPIFRHAKDEAFELSQATFYYQVLGNVR